MKPKRIVSKDQDLNLVQDSVAELADKISPLCFSFSLLGPIKLVTGSNSIAHKLQTKLRGWVVVGRNSGAVIFDEQATNKFPQTYLKLNASSAVTVTLLVF